MTMMHGTVPVSTGALVRQSNGRSLPRGEHSTVPVSTGAMVPPAGAALAIKTENSTAPVSTGALVPLLTRIAELSGAAHSTVPVSTGALVRDILTATQRSTHDIVLFLFPQEHWYYARAEHHHAWVWDSTVPVSTGALVQERPEELLITEIVLFLFPQEHWYRDP